MECESDQTRMVQRGSSLRVGNASRAVLPECGATSRVPSAATLEPSLPWPTDDDAPRLVVANAGDHKLVHALLRAVHQTPSYEDFVTWLDEPAYDPADRLLAKHGDQIIAHVQVLRRVAWFDGVQVPIGNVQDLAALPEYRRAGYERLLLAAAQQAMAGSHAIVSLVRTSRPEPLRAGGWSDVATQGYTQANVSDILAHLSAQTARLPRRVASSAERRRGRVRIRPWRHVELDAVRDVYSSAAAGLWGAIHRNGPYWQWLAGRKAHSELLVAVEGRDDWENFEAGSHIVGYAVTHGSDVIELCCLPDYAAVAAPRLLARACQDAIEHDLHTLTLHTPVCDPLHELIVTAGGTWCGNGHSTADHLLVKLLDPPRWIEMMYPVLRRRAQAAGIDRPCNVDFEVSGRRLRLMLTRRSGRLVTDDLAAAAAAEVSCNRETFAALLMGNLNVARAHDAGQIAVAGDAVLARLAALFPPALFWQSPFDMLRF
jgi:GNAT superfamily N-acetyltransferase